MNKSAWVPVLALVAVQIRVCLQRKVADEMFQGEEKEKLNHVPTLITTSLYFKPKEPFVTRASRDGLGEQIRFPAMRAN